MAKAQQKERPRLGRGLSSLISVGEETSAARHHSEAAETVASAASAATLANTSPSSAGAPADLPIAEIVPNPHQPRRSMNEAAIAELAASLKATGLIQPVVVRSAPRGYELIAGERRLRAAKLAGFTTIPAIVRDVDPPTQAQMALVENIQREDLNPIDRAIGYRTLMDQLGLTQAELSGRLGEDRSSIANFLRLLELAEPVKALVREGQLSLGHAKLLASVADILEQERLARTVVNQSLSVRNLERLIQEGGMPKAARHPLVPSAHIAEMERSLTRELGMRVQLRSAKNGRGRLIIHYPSLDQFDQLMSKLGVSSSSIE